MDCSLTARQSTGVPAAAPGPPAAPSYMLVGPPDLLHDLTLDCEDIGWQVSVAGWKAVISAAPEDAAAPAPEGPTEITLSGVGREGHSEACRTHLGTAAGGP
jgi:hypothetical protein